MDKTDSRLLIGLDTLDAIEAHAKDRLTKVTSRGAIAKWQGQLVWVEAERDEILREAGIDLDHLPR